MVTITAVNNALDEPNKSVTVSGAVSHNGVVTPASKTLTITDDDPAPMLSIDSPSVTEGDSGSKNLTFTATLSAASGRQVTVDYADAGTGTATSGTDYTAITADTLTFAAGTISQTFNVAVTGDVLDEADETVKVQLKDPVNAAVSTTAGAGTGTITDNDATPTLSISSPSVAEGDSGSTSLTYTVTLSAASGRQVTVQYADAGTGTATSGTDYTAITAGALTFAAGTTSQTFSVLVTGDTVNESDETILVSLSNAANATVSSTVGTGTGTITDDDDAPTSITLTVDDDDVGEGRRGHHDQGDRHGGRHDPVRRSQDGAGERVGERRDGELGGLRDGARLRHRDRGRGGERYRNLHADADGRHGGRDRRDDHGQRHIDRPDGEPRHDQPDGRRRDDDLDHADGGRQQCGRGRRGDHDHGYGHFERHGPVH